MGKNADKIPLLFAGLGDDNVLPQEIFEHEFLIERAENGTEALSKLRSEPTISAIVMDMHLSDPDIFAVFSAMQENAELRDIPAVVIADRDDSEGQLRVLDAGAQDIIAKPVNPQIALRRIRNAINRREAACQLERNRVLEDLLHQSEIDDKTGIFNKTPFIRKTAEMLRQYPDEKFVILRWDIDSFKIYNDLFGIDAGDALLAFIGDAYRRYADKDITYGHWDSDHFVTCMTKKRFDADSFEKRITRILSEVRDDFDFIVRIGVYEIDDLSVDVALMCDRAFLALRSIKGNYYTRVAYYSDSMRDSMMEEKEILGDMKRALEQKQFVVYLQPQYNYASGTLHGAEALIRWEHPTKGLIPPGKFIPIFERNGFITNVDEYVWETVCALLRRWLDEGMNTVPVSVNISRRDIYRPDLCSVFTGLIDEYGLDASMLRLEITETAYMEDAELLIRTVDELRSAGFSIEMDDFGSGYSSLNTLKNVPVDTLKLDMKFLEKNLDNSRGGSILTSVIRMAHWIKLPVIAEGVETKLQADYLKSVGCIYMQGYYFARPMPIPEYERVLRGSTPETGIERVFPLNDRGSENFLSVSTQSTLLFNSFVGGAAIIEFDGSNAEALRVNDKFYEIIGMSREDFAKVRLHLQNSFDDKNRGLFRTAIKGAIASGEESSCEVVMTPPKAGAEPVWLRIQMRFLAQNGEQNLIYMSIENISMRVRLLHKNMQLNDQLTAVMDSVPGGIYDFEIDDEIRVTYFNDTAAAMFGYTRQEYGEIVGSHLMSLVNPDDMPALLQKLKGLTNGNVKLFEHSYRHRHSSGRWVWVHMTGRVVRKGDKKVSASGILMDIDAQVHGEMRIKKQTQALERQSEFLKTLYDTIPCGIAQFQCDPKRGELGKLVSLNDTTWKIFGYSGKEKYLETVKYAGELFIIHPDDLGEVTDCIKRAIVGERYNRIDYDHRIIRPDGSIRWIQSLIQKVSHPDDGGEMIQVVFSDITERKQESLQYINNALFRLYDEVYEINTAQHTSMLRFSRIHHSCRLGKTYAVDDYVSRLCGDDIYEDDRERIDAFYADIVKRTESENCTVEFRRVRADGEIRWISAMALHVSGPSYLICNRDITELKNAQQLAMENEKLRLLVNERHKEYERSRIFIESTGILMFDYDPMGDVLIMQRRGRDGLIEETTESFIATIPFNKSIRVTDRKSVERLFSEASESPMRRSAEYHLSVNGHSYIPCRLQLVSMEDETGRVYRIIGQISRVNDEHKRLLTSRINDITGHDYTDVAYHHVLIREILSILDNEPNTATAVKAVLTVSGRRLGVSGAYILRTRDSMLFESSCEWHSMTNGNRSKTCKLRFDSESKQAFEESMNDGIFTFSNVSKLSDRFGQLFVDQEITAAAICSMPGEGEVYLVFDEMINPREWTKTQKETLKLVAFILGAYLHAGWGTASDPLPDTIKSELDNCGAYVYLINPDTFEVLYQNPALTEAIGENQNGVPCYKSMANRDEICEDCPVKVYFKTGLSLPKIVHENGCDHLFQASPFIWNGHKAILISKTTPYCHCLSQKPSDHKEQTP